MMEWFKLLLSILLIGVSVTVHSQAAGQDGSSVVDEVVRLKPVGYWPADEGKGEVLHDQSGRKNHGKIYNVTWRDGYLVFDNDFYQWIEVPHKKGFGSKTFTMGGWVYHCLDKNHQGESRVGAIVMGHPFQKNGKWGAIWGDRLDNSSALLRIFTPPKESTSCVEIGSGHVNDALGTLKDKNPVAYGKWQHLLYTYDAAAKRGSIYLNGELVSSKENVPFEPVNTALVIGGGRWGTFNLGGNMSMDGTLRNMVFFDRALSAAEVQRLCKITRPSIRPNIAPYSQRYAKRKAAYDKAVMAKEITSPKASYKLNELIQRVQNKELDRYARGKAAIQLAAMGEKAKAAIPVLVAELQGMMDKDGAHLPKVEEFFRNALIRALLDINREDARAKPVLAEAFVKPFFKRIDTTQSYCDKTRPLIRNGKWSEALQAYKAHMKSLPEVKKHNKWGSYDSIEQVDEVSRIFPLGVEYFDGYMSGGVPYLYKYSAYNIVDNTRDGYSYVTMRERIPYDEVQRQFDQHLKALTRKRPDLEHEHKGKHARTWTRKWSRVKIVQMTPDGKRKQVTFVGPWFIYDAEDAKNDGWSIITDEKGYIHVLGGQHNTPNEEFYVPGIWPKLGMKEGEAAGVLYWVSKRPHDITEFELVGQKNNPRKVSGGLNYMNFARSRDGRIFLYGRGDTWAFILHRYDAGRRQWTRIKGNARGMMGAAKQRNPKWSARLGRTSVYYGPSDGLIVAFQPGAYNFCRTWPNLVGNDIRGVGFDPSGRMHICLALLGVIEDGEVTHRPVYAYSDDLGDTFYSADGKGLKLPLTHNPIPGHNADRTLEPARSHFEVWVSLVREYQ